MLGVFGTVERSLHSHRFMLLWAGFAFLCIFAFFKNLGYHLANDTPSYAVGDLLLNYAGGASRRGLLGTIAIFFSKSVGGLPWVWAWAIGCVLTGVLFTFTIRMLRHLPDTPIFMPMVLAPWGLLFLAYDEGAALRKEMLGYLALVLILQAMTAASAQKAMIWVLAGAGVFLASLFAHEAIVLMGPAHALAVLLIAQKWPDLRAKLYSVIAAVIISASLIVVYLYLLPKPNVDAICAATRAGCHSSAKWLAQGTAENIRYTLDIRGWPDILKFGSWALLCAIPMLGLRAVVLSYRQQVLTVLIVAGSILPLFVLAADWGRWVNWALYPLCLIALAGVSQGMVTYRRILPAWAAVLYVSTWNLMHGHSGIAPRGVFILLVLTGLVLAHWLYNRWRAGRRL